MSTASDSESEDDLAFIGRDCSDSESDDGSDAGPSHPTDLIDMRVVVLAADMRWLMKKPDFVRDRAAARELQIFFGCVTMMTDTPHAVRAMRAEFPTRRRLHMAVDKALVPGAAARAGHRAATKICDLLKVYR